MNTLVYIGLGNPGSAFAGTRHNLGIDTLRAWVEAKASDQVRCFFPGTMMNDSGRAVAAYLKKTALSVDDILVIHDDVELPLGEVRLARRGSAKGHNGVRSIQAALGTNDFRRLRLGVGRPPEGMDLSDFVLEKFRPEEQEAVQRMIQDAIKILSRPFENPFPSADGSPLPYKGGVL